MNKKETISGGLLLGLFGGLLNCFNPALAADHYNLEDGLPTELEDSIPTAYLNRELQGKFSWEHTREGEEIFTLEPRLEYGIFRNAQIELDVPFWLGDGVEEEGLGDVVLGALYNFHQETLWMPAPSLAGHVIFPTNDESDGVDTVLKLILSKTIGRGYTWQRVHLNVLWNYNSDAHEDERENYFAGIIGYGPSDLPRYRSCSGFCPGAGERGRPGQQSGGGRYPVSVDAPGRLDGRRCGRHRGRFPGLSDDHGVPEIVLKVLSDSSSRRSCHSSLAFFPQACPLEPTDYCDTQQEISHVG